jgi:hypothetical protein
MSHNKNSISAWTDYPIDDDHSTKKVQVLRYDRNKYASVQWGDKFESIKVGYLFQDIELQRRLSALELYMLPAYEGDRYHSRREATETLRKETRRRINYDLWVGQNRLEFSSLSAALKKLAKHLIKVDCVLSRTVRCNYGFRSEPLIESENGYFSLFINNKKRPILKTRHVKIMQLSV